MPKRLTAAEKEELPNLAELLERREPEPVVDPATGEVLAGPSISKKQERLRAARRAKEEAVKALGADFPGTQRGRWRGGDAAQGTQEQATRGYGCCTERRSKDHRMRVALIELRRRR